MCVCSMWIFYGFLLSSFVAFTVPLEAVRMAPTWQAAFILVERLIYGLINVATPFFGVLSDRTVSA